MLAFQLQEMHLVSLWLVSMINACADELLMNVLFPAPCWLNFYSHPHLFHLPLNLSSCSYLSFVFLTRFTLKSFHLSLLLYFPLYHLLLSSISLLLSSYSCSLRVELVLRPPLPRLWDPPLFQLNMPGTSTWPCPCPMYLALPTMRTPSPQLTILNLPKRSSHTRVQMCPWWPKEKDWHWT